MDKLTVEQAQRALDAAWDAHQRALDSGKARAIDKAYDAVYAAATALRSAQHRAANHAAMDAARKAGAR